jgi:hypothetical protein
LQPNFYVIAGNFASFFSELFHQLLIKIEPAPAPILDEVHRFISSDGNDPAKKLRIGIEVIEFPPSRHRRLLQDILSIGRIPDESENVSKQALLIRTKEVGELVFLAGHQWSLLTNKNRRRNDEALLGGMPWSFILIDVRRGEPFIPKLSRTRDFGISAACPSALKEGATSNSAACTAIWLLKLSTGPASARHLCSAAQIQYLRICRIVDEKMLPADIA